MWNISFGRLDVLVWPMFVTGCNPSVFFLSNLSLPKRSKTFHKWSICLTPCARVCWWPAPDMGPAVTATTQSQLCFSQRCQNLSCLVWLTSKSNFFILIFINFNILCFLGPVSLLWFTVCSNINMCYSCILHQLGSIVSTIIFHFWA